jgi:hypothetical protein
MLEFDIFTAARLRDFPVLFAAASQCKKLWPKSRLVVAVPSGDQAVVQRGLRGLATVINENELLVGFDRSAFQSRPIAYFPQAFGWYLQQILKMEYCRQSQSDYCLVWDADTVPLKAFDFLDESGRVYLTKAEEFHHPYFYTISQLLAIVPPAQTSFISQHMFVKCQSMRDMCQMIARIHNVDHWADALGDILEGHPSRENLFSEYETYANYMLAVEPSAVIPRDLMWGRYNSTKTWAVPTKSIASARQRGLFFAAFESRNAVQSRMFHKALERAPSLIKKLAVAFVLRQAS